jgi:hypothetical protein
MPVRSAMRFASPICSVKGVAARGRCSSVCPWLPMARTALAARPDASSSRSAAVANTSPTSASSAPRESILHAAGSATAACSRFESSDG